MVWPLHRDSETGMEVCAGVGRMKDDPRDGSGGGASGGSGSAEVRGKGGWKRGIDFREVRLSSGPGCMRSCVGSRTGHARKEVNGEEEEEDVEND